MIESVSIGSRGTGDVADAPQGNARIADAARQFEALLIGQVLKSMRDSGGGWMGTGDDESSSSAMDYAQEIFAQSLSAQGGLGMASLIVRGLDTNEHR
jgi:Rod binding domain-containing protein